MKSFKRCEIETAYVIASPLPPPTSTPRVCPPVWHHLMGSNLWAMGLHDHSNLLSDEERERESEDVWKEPEGEKCV